MFRFFLDLSQLKIESIWNIKLQAVKYTLKLYKNTNQHNKAVQAVIKKECEYKKEIVGVTVQLYQRLCFSHKKAESLRERELSEITFLKSVSLESRVFSVSSSVYTPFSKFS